MRGHDWPLWLTCTAAVLVCGLWVSVAAGASAGPGTVPHRALAHKATLIRAARAEFGLGAPVALLAAQIHTESAWQAGAVSPVGAQGLAQFMPATARWLPQVVPALTHLGEEEAGVAPAPFNPGWAIRAMCGYDKWLWKKIVLPGNAPAAVNEQSACSHRWAFVLSAYNGGLGWVIKDRAMAPRLGKDKNQYWGQVELVNAGRSAAAIKENRAYPKRIFSLVPVYAKAGWPQGECE
ncbi:transglycosylase SLT domain-containing protein [Desulfovibrio cuneatus]|uniref:transglycosylase SLT domain-containing protein n=1 Tax=Desulfovibrio cuneatus TaxID=159728 RepID=UPI000550BD3D|nr:transglycosylase SLT domain-containing protein [Desulfovibrio cuneatus]